MTIMLISNGRDSVEKMRDIEKEKNFS